MGFYVYSYGACTGQAWYVKSLKFLCKSMIMYGILSDVQDVCRLATGLGDLKSIWILAQVAVRFPGRYRVVSEP